MDNSQTTAHKRIPALRLAVYIASAVMVAVMLTLTMLAHIFTSSREMLDARRSRGGSFLRHPIANTREYTLSLLLRLFEDMGTMDLALRSRLYDENAARMALPFRKRDAIMTLCLTILPVAEKLL